MSSNRPAHRQKRFWGAAWTAAILVHIFVFCAIAWFMRPDYLVKVVKMTPMPGETLNLLETQAVRSMVYFSQALPQIDKARLCRLDEAGAPVECFRAMRHAEHEEALVFEPVHEEGRYAVLVAEGSFDAPWLLDGEYLGRFPSGDGEGGGEFRATFDVKRKAEEIFSATVFDEKKPQMNEEIPTSVSQPTKTEQQPTPPPQPKKRPPKPPKKTQAPPPTAPVQAPVPSAPPTPTDPLPENDQPKFKLTPEMLAVTAETMAPSLLLDAAVTADGVFQARDTQTFVAQATEDKARLQSAYSKPNIGVGEQGNSISHDKDVTEYLAKMHVKIHPIWAEGYLIRLDTIYRGSSGQGLNNPNLEAILEIVMDSIGQVSEVHVVRSSGITDYDAEAIRTAWRSSPGIHPPKVMLSQNGKTYIHWTFWRDYRACGVFGVSVYRQNKGNRENIEFNLKQVQHLEKQLGLKTTYMSGYQGLPSSGTPSPTPSPSPTPPPIFPQPQPSTEPKSEKINPLED